MERLKIENLSKSYGGNRGIFRFSLELAEGDTMLLLGPNGAGKTTAMMGMIGGFTPDAGEVRIGGFDPYAQRKEALRVLGAMVGNPALYLHLTGAEHATLHQKAHRCLNAPAAREMLYAMGLEDAMHRPVATYSTGMRRRLLLGLTMLHKPEVLILDEPFEGMDIEGREQMRTRILEYRQAHQAAIVISSHVLEDATSFATHVSIIKEGNTLFQGAIDSVARTERELKSFYFHTLEEEKKGQNHELRFDRNAKAS